MTEQTPVAALAPETVSVRVDDLIIGRTTAFPIYDERGLLLIAEGIALTPEIKRNLRERPSGRVMVHAADASHLTLTDAGLARQDCVTFDSETTEKLDEIAHRGFGAIINTERPLRESIPDRAPGPYSAEQRRRLQEANEKTAAEVGQMMEHALQGQRVHGGEMTSMIASYVGEMIQDTDNVLTSVSLEFAGRGLPTNPLATSLLSMAIGVELGWDAGNIRNLGICGLVHDWGMLRVPAEIRNASRRLDTGDWIEITKHPIYSLEMLQKIAVLPPVVPLVVYQVHERPNGKGYPRGRSGSSIHPFAKVVQVADIFTALRSPRPYRAPLMPYAAMECLIRQARDHYVEPYVVRALLRIQSLFPLGSFVTLSDGSVARVLRSNRDDYTRPIVQLVQDAKGKTADPHAETSLVDMRTSTLAIRQALPTPGTQEVAFFEDLLQDA
jgi:HD-GYP domain-containing protein (c-di-GMP phosphodiesterase class II)